MPTCGPRPNVARERWTDIVFDSDIVRFDPTTDATDDWDEHDRDAISIWRRQDQGRQSVRRRSSLPFRICSFENELSINRGGWFVLEVINFE